MAINVSISDDSVDEIDPMRQLSVLILALADCLRQFPIEDRELIIDGLQILVRETIASR